MKAIHLLPVGVAEATPPDRRLRATCVPLELLDELAAVLARRFRVSCHVRREVLDVHFAYDPARRQYHSTAILERLQRLASVEEELRLLGITALDLYVPVLTFVFGEAQLSGRCALVSLHRLQEEFYGLPASNDRLHERLVKEAVHELGHTFGLRHCSNWQCVMASTHAVERLDVKGIEFCTACQAAITWAPLVRVSHSSRPVV